MLLRAIAALLLATATVAAQADSWLLSIVSGEAAVIDGTRRFAATAGQRLGPGAIVETTSTAALLRFESADAVTIDLGPDTRAMLAPAGLPPRQGRVPQVYVLQGWVKVATHETAVAPGLRSPGIELAPFSGAVVVQAGRREQAVFVERGRVDVVERRAGSVQPLAEGQFYAGDGARRGGAMLRPPAGWAEKVPRAFRDPVPLRAKAWAERRVEPVPLPDPGYVQLADWLTAEPELRAPLTARFTPLLRDPAFRAQVQANLAAHPEWRPVLFPPPERPASAAVSAPRSRP